MTIYSLDRGARAELFQFFELILNYDWMMAGLFQSLHETVRCGGSCAMTCMRALDPFQTELQTSYES